MLCVQAEFMWTLDSVSSFCGFSVFPGAQQVSRKGHGKEMGGSSVMCGHHIVQISWEGSGCQNLARPPGRAGPRVRGGEALHFLFSRKHCSLSLHHW